MNSLIITDGLAFSVGPRFHFEADDPCPLEGFVTGKSMLASSLGPNWPRTINNGNVGDTKPKMVMMLMKMMKMMMGMVMSFHDG